MVAKVAGPAPLLSKNITANESRLGRYRFPTESKVIPAAAGERTGRQNLGHGSGGIKDEDHGVVGAEKDLSFDKGLRGTAKNGRDGGGGTAKRHGGTRSDAAGAAEGAEPSGENGIIRSGRVAVSVTGVFAGKLNEQVGGQLIPAGALVTVPVPLPGFGLST